MKKAKGYYEKYIERYRAIDWGKPKDKAKGDKMKKQKKQKIGEKKTAKRKRRKEKRKRKKAKNSQVSPNQDFASPSEKKDAHRGSYRHFDRVR